MAPVAARRLLEGIGLGIGNTAETADRFELLQQLLFADRVFRRIDRLRVWRLQVSDRCDRQEHQGEGNAKGSCESLHGIPSGVNLFAVAMS